MSYEEKIFESFLLEFLPLFFKVINPVIHREKSLEFSLNENQIKLMMSVKIVGPLTPTVISKFLDQPKGSLTTIIDSLENYGFVLRQKDLKDRRKQIIKLTEKGNAFMDKKMKKNISILSRLLADCPKEDQKLIYDGITKFSEYLRKTEGI